MVSAPPERRSLGPALGAELRAARERAGVELREAARRADVGHPYLVGLERGERAPSGAVAARLAALLRLDAQTTAALYAVAAQVDAARREREGARGRPNRVRRPRGARDAARARRAEAQKRYADEQGDHVLASLLGHHYRRLRLGP